MEITNCNVASWSSNLLEDCRKTLAENKIKCDMANPYYVPQLSQKLKTFLPYFPLYSGIMISIFGYGQINASSLSVESEIKDIKHILLKNNQRESMRADKFVTTHIRSFAGTSLLAMATHDSLFSVKNNESITKTGVISSSISETEPIIPISRESNLSENVSNSLIMLNESKFKIDSNSPTCIEIESSKESDIISTDINELNLEHNWRNKNTTQKNKRKTYLDKCPDWDNITHIQKRHV